jgi:hypothetical protein
MLVQAAPQLQRTPRPSAPASPAFTPARSVLLQRKCACGGTAGAGGECEECKKKKMLQRRAANTHFVSSVPPIVHNVLSSSGRPLDVGTRGFMEPRLGHDFSQVRVHDDARAAESARAVNADAYTVGQDIVFGSDRYRPESQSGRELLAHELAHTVQQRGLQRSGPGLEFPSNVEDQIYEREARQFARRIVNYPYGTPPHSVQSRPAGEIVSRQPSNATTQSVPGVSAPVRSWTDLPANSSLRVRGITAWQSQGDQASFRVASFKLPAAKGPVLDKWQARATAQALEATIEFRGAGVPPRAGLWQTRDKTNELRESWLGKLGWTAANAAANWHSAGGAAAAGGVFYPRAANHTCQMDHIVELQLGGTNSRQNIQVLDPAENQQSGGAIWNYVSSLATEARSSLPDPKPTYITLHFDAVDYDPAPPNPGGCPPAGSMIPAQGTGATCMQVEVCALTRTVALVAGQDAAGRTLESYPVDSAGTRDILQVLPAPQPTDLTGDENSAPAQLIAGLQLHRLTRTPGTNPDSIDARIDPRTILSGRSQTRVPATVEGNPGPLVFAVNKQNGQMRLVPGAARPGFDFLLPYLSRGHLNLAYSPTEGLSGTGSLTPSLPLLNRAAMNVEFGRDRFRIFYGQRNANIRSPIPGLRFTEATLGLELLPAFRPSGRLAFEVGSPAILTGSVDASADTNGLVFDGTLDARIPGTDQARGELHYRNSQWSGFVVVDSSKIRLPGFQRGELRIDFNADGSFRPSGTVELLVAGNPVTLRASYERSRLILSGDANIRVPGLQPVVLSLRHDGEHLTGVVATGVTIGGLTGNVRVAYRDGRISGTGTVAIQRGRASGSITLQISEAGNLFGEGTATVRLTDNLIGTVAIIKPERGPVRVNGELRFPQPIQLFRAIEQSHTLFERTLEFPIPGLSIPIVNIGVIATLTGRLSVGYGFGPGILADVRVAVGFNPLEENTDIAIDAAGRLNVPAHAELSLSIRAGAGLSAGVARITGGITGTGTVGLRGGFAGAIEFRYRNAVYLLEAEAAIRMRPVFRLGLDADITAEVGAFGYTAARWQKVWNLYAFEWGANAEAGLIARLRYSSTDGLTLPSPQNIQWIVPQIEPSQILSDMFRRARSSAQDLA